MNRLINLSRALPTPDSALTVAYTPIRLEMPGRQPLELRLTAPATGDALPIVILSHGFGPSKYIPSKYGYAPLAQFWLRQPSEAPDPGGNAFDGPPARMYSAPAALSDCLDDLLTPVWFATLSGRRCPASTAPAKKGRSLKWSFFRGMPRTARSSGMAGGRC